MKNKIIRDPGIRLVNPVCLLLLGGLFLFASASEVEAATGLTGVTSTGNVNLSSATYVRVPKAASGETCDVNAKGSIYYDTDDDHFYGCNGATWKQLDN